jgi:tRNA A37 methylthiotransferase MiaB
VKRRTKIVFEQISKLSMESNKKWIGWRGRVLFDEKTDEGIKGRNFAYKPVSVADKVNIGESHIVEITDASVKRLVGKIAS